MHRRETVQLTFQMLQLCLGCKNVQRNGARLYISEFLGFSHSYHVSVVSFNASCTFSTFTYNLCVTNSTLWDCNEMKCSVALAIWKTEIEGLSLGETDVCEPSALPAALLYSAH